MKFSMILLTLTLLSTSVFAQEPTEPAESTVEESSQPANASGMAHKEENAQKRIERKEQRKERRAMREERREKRQERREERKEKRENRRANKK